MDAFDPAAVFSSIDEQGRYAYGNQPHAAAWNLARLAESLLPLLDENAARAVELATEVIESFAAQFASHWLKGMRRKIGLNLEEAGDRALIDDLLDAMHRHQADFTLTFRGLCNLATDQQRPSEARGSFEDTRDFQEWVQRWRVRAAREPTAPAARATAMRQVNPAYIPRNHRIEQVITAAVERRDFAPFEQLSAVLSQPYQEKSEFAEFAYPPLPAERVLQTFCGT
jgi:uncharacterized protein YdiU (UPF0061 family)